jgi:uncharacterized protein (DUF1778 family)
VNVRNQMRARVANIKRLIVEKAAAIHGASEATVSTAFPAAMSTLPSKPVIRIDKRSDVQIGW